MSHYDVALCYTMTLCYVGGEQTTSSDEAKPADDSAAAPAEGEAAPAATEGESQDIECLAVVVGELSTMLGLREMCNQQYRVVINHIASFALILLYHKEKTIIAIREYTRQLRSGVFLTIL